MKKYVVKQTKCREVDQQKKFPYRLGYGACGTLMLIVIWAVGGTLIFNRPGYEQFAGFLPKPTLAALERLILEKHFWLSVLASLRRVLLGIFIAFAIGFPSGLFTGYFRVVRLAANPPMQFLRMISPLAWMPIALLVFRSFESAIYFLIIMATVWPIIINTMLGVSRVNPQWIKMARNQGAKTRHVILYIIIPASFPYILTSLRLALGVAWIVLVPAEYLGVSSGLGYLINDARDILEYDRLMAIVVAIGIIGYLLDGSLLYLQKLLKWTWVAEE